MKAEIDSFLNYLAKERGLTPNTIAAYRNDLNQFAESSKVDLNLESSLNNQFLLEYIGKLQEKRYKSTTLARKIVAIKSFIKFLVKCGKLPEGIAEGLKSGRVNRVSPKFLSIPEIRRLLDEPAKLSSPEAKRDKAMLELLYATGLRVSELISLNVPDVNFESGIIHCPRRHKENRYIFVDPPVMRLIKDYLETARPELAKEQETALFINQRGGRLTRQGFWQIVKEYSNKAGLGNKGTPNILRHSFAIHQLRSGADLSSVQKMLGHAYLATTKIYEKVK